MSDKQQILTMLRAELGLWDELLAGLSEEQIVTPRRPGNRSVQDDVAHLRAWQQRSIARLEAALHGGQPEFPAWPAGLDPDAEDQTDRINGWIYETHRDRSWPDVHREWRAGFSRFVELAEAIPEADLLEPGRYEWLGGHPLSLVLTASHEHHHRDHLEPLVIWLWQQGSLVFTPAGRHDEVANRSMPPGAIIPELVYDDVASAVAWLCRTFGFQERLRIGSHRAQLVFGDASIIVIGRGAGASAPADAERMPEAAQSVMVRVADVDRHHERARAAGARVVHPPETYPYGERQYTVDDPGSHRWTFSQSVADVDPETWGGRWAGGEDRK